jgi:integrase
MNEGQSPLRETNKGIEEPRERKNQMASIVRLGKGKQPPRGIEFIGPDGKRHRLRIGKVDADTAGKFKRGIEQLLNSVRLGTTLPDEWAGWLASVDDALVNRMAAAGLCSARVACPNLGVAFEQYVQRRAVELKPSSLKRIQDTGKRMRAFFGDWVLMRSIGPAQVKDWRGALLKDKLSEATVRTDCRNAKAFFADAIERGQLRGKNPFDAVPVTAIASQREHRISAIQTRALLDACPNAKWRVLVGLLRFAGLRCPSETHSVTWADVDWLRNALRVYAPKTNQTRMVPICADLLGLLRDAWDAAPEGATTIVGVPRNNRHKRLKAIIERAGLTVWPKLFQVFRMTRRSEWLDAGVPAAYVNAWMGHSGRVGDTHYTVLSETIFKAATAAVECPEPEPQNVTAKSGAKSGAAGGRNGQKWAESDSAGDVGPECENADIPCETACFSAFEEMNAPGLEPGTYGLKVPESASSQPQKEPRITAPNGDALECLPAGCQQNAGHLDATSVYLLGLFRRLSLLEQQTFLRMLSEQVNGRMDADADALPEPAMPEPAVPTEQR